MNNLEISDLRIDPSPRDAAMTRLSMELTYPEWWSRPERIWFEIPTELRHEAPLSGDAWMISLLPLAVTLGAPIAMDLPVDPQLVANARKLMQTWNNWYPALRPVPLHVPTSDSRPSTVPSRTAAFFSGGVELVLHPPSRSEDRTREHRRLTPHPWV